MKTNLTRRVFSKEPSLGAIGGAVRVIVLAMVLSCLIATPLAAQQKRSTLSNLASSPAVISKLDWLMLKAEVEAMRASQPVSDVGWPSYHYDKSGNVVRAFVFVNPQWWQHANIKTVKEKLSEEGGLYSSTLFYSVPQLGALLKKDATRLEVHFYTWSKTANQIELATYFYEKGELILK